MYPADRKLSSSIDFDGSSLYGNPVKAKTPLNKILRDFSEILLKFDNLLNLDELDKSDTSLYKDFDKYTDKDKIAYLFNVVGASVVEINNALGTVMQGLQTEDSSVSSALYKMKTVEDDSDPGFLTEKLIAEQTGALALDSSKEQVVLKGAVPTGAIIFINSREKSNFDATGKGKTNTIYFGYAIANGQNGTDNLLKDVYLRISSDLDKAGKIEGSDNFKVKLNNIESFEVGIEGGAGNALSTTQRFITKLKKMLVGSSTSNQKTVYSPDGTDGEDSINSQETNLEHTHSLSLKAKHVNNTVTPIDLTPKGIYLIPIQKI